MLQTINDLLDRMFMFARTDATGMVDSNGDEALLAESYGNVIEAYQKMSHVNTIKQDGLGDPSTGSMVFSRFKNATVRNYGTARAAGKGDAGVDDQVPVNLDQKKEIVEELENADIKMYGVGNLVKRFTARHGSAVTVHLDTIALAALKTAAAAASNDANITWPKNATPDYYDLVEQAILKVTTVKNNYVNGVERSMVHVFLKPSIYSKVKQKLETVYAYNGKMEIEQVPGLGGASIHEELFLPSNTDFIVTVAGNVAQPAYSAGYVAGDRIPLTDAIELSMFLKYGTKVLAKDLVFEGEFSEALS